MKFNEYVTNRTLNHEDSVAYKMTHELELYQRVLTSLVGEDKFYESKENSDFTIMELTQKVDPNFLAGLAVYAREDMCLRSIPLLLSVLLLKTDYKKSKKVIERVIQRADEITEILAVYGKVNGKEFPSIKPLANQLKIGIAKSFNKFNEYHFAKYNRKGGIKLKDALKIVHPKAKDEQQQELFNKIANDSLKIPDTWETKLSSGEDKKETWKRLINSKKLGFMALLRNLRNILQAEVSEETIEKVVAFLTNENAIKNSKQFPFRFLSAYKELKQVDSPYTSKIMDALEDAVLFSARNLPKLGGTTVIASDVSGSMENPISKNSKVENVHIGLLLASLAQQFCDKTITGIFGDEWKVKQYSSKAPLANVDSYVEGEVGYSTHGYKVIDYLLENKIKVDRIMLFTDCQLYGESLIKKVSKYRNEVNPNFKVYTFDLSGYGTVQIPENDNNSLLIAGWSDKVFTIIDDLENGKQSDIINKVTKIGKSI